MGSDHHPSDADHFASDRWRRICAVLDRVLDAESSDAGVILEEACRAEGVSIGDASRYLAASRSESSFLQDLDPKLMAAALGPNDDRKSLSAGSRLGQYQVLAPIAAGAMGEVYRARDTRLQRDIALKVLPPRLASDTERLMRFKREAHMLASLNHPNIAAIYGFEEFESSPHCGEIVVALALELVDGPTLADRLADGALGYRLALSIAHQIVDSLQSAHDAGIVHCDLKPSNVALCEPPTGRSDDVVAKVLDFGVAKALNGIEVDVRASAVSDPADSGATRAGTLIGTSAYMAPEQIEGKPVDQRADIWAFGCVLYEMLTGHRAFNGRDVADPLNRAITSEPDWTKLPADTPLSLRRLLRRCLEKDRRRRLAHAADARLDLEDAEAELVAPPDRSRASSRVTLLAGAAVVLAVVAGMAGWLWGRQQAPEAPLVTRLTMPLAGNIDRPAVSPDGSQVAFVSRIPTRRIVLRRLDQRDEQSVPGTEDATVPTFSPDARWLAYRTTVQIDGADVSRLKKIPVTGGASVTLVDSVMPNGGLVAWGDDGYIYYIDNGVMRVSSAGGPPERILARDEKEGELGFSKLDLLPDRDWLLFTVSVGSSQAAEAAHRRVVAFNMKTRERRVLLPSEGPAAYAQTGRDPASSDLLFERDGSLFAVPFDAKRMRVTGTATRVIERDETATLAPNLPVGVSRTGTLAYVVRNGDGAAGQSGTLMWVDRQGTETPVPGLPSRPYSAPSISADGKRMAVNILRPGQRDVLSDIWTYDFALGQLTRATFDGRSVGRDIVWSPDSTRLIYAARTDSQLADLTAVPADGSGNPVRLQQTSARALDRPDLPLPVSISPDARFLIGTALGRGRPAIFGVRLDGAGTSGFEPLLDLRMIERNPRFSPNGRWIAYQSNRSGRMEIWVAPHPMPNQRWQQISTDGGTEPKWSSSGRELFYRNGNRMMVVSVDTGAVFRAETPKILFEGSLDGGYDVTPDGKRFLIIKRDSRAMGTGAEPSRGELRIVLNWFEELRRRTSVPH